MKLRDVIIFVAGAAVGGAVAAKLVSKKYEKIIDDEIESVKEAFKEQKNAIIDEYEKKLDNNEAPEIEAELANRERICTREELLEEVNKISDDNGYTPVDMDLPEDIKPKKYLNNTDMPYTIYPRDVGELPGYRVVSVTLYSNGIATELVDTGDNCVEELIYDIDEILGEENFARIGEIEPDMVYIRNDMYKTDYVVYASDDEYED